MPRLSAFKDQKPFDTHHWIVTTFNAGNPDGGHAALLVEGEDEAGRLLIYRCEIFASSFKDYLRWYMDPPPLRPGQISTFDGFYAENLDAIASIENEIVCYVVKKNYADYPAISRGTFADCTSTSWRVTEANAKAMLRGIDTEKREIEIATRVAIESIRQGDTPNLAESFTLFKLYGHASTLSPPPGQDADGINCVNWCNKHLPAAGIAPASNVSYSFGAKPEWHAKQAHSGPYS